MKPNYKKAIAHALLRANHSLNNSAISEDAKAWICTNIENILLDCGMYCGFAWTKWFFGGGYKRWVADGSKHGDEHKYSGGGYERFYFVHGDLVEFYYDRFKELVNSNCIDPDNPVARGVDSAEGCPDEKVYHNRVEVAI